MTYLQKIDAVLNLFGKDDFHISNCYFATEIRDEIYEIYPDLKDDIKSNNDIGRCFSQLLNDGYIETIKVTVGQDTKKQEAAFISYKGLMFIEQGGYAKQSELLDAEIHWKKNLEVQSLNNAARLNYLTFALAIGTFLLVLIEIIKHFGWALSINLLTALYVFLLGVSAGLLALWIAQKVLRQME